MKFKAVLAAAVAFGVTTPLFASETEHLGEIAGWDVYIDHGEGLGCFMHSEFDDGTSFRIGMMEGGESAYMLALNEEWDFFEDGEEYLVTADVDGDEFEGIGAGIVVDGVPGIDILFDSEEFANALAESSILSVSLAGEELYALDMTGTGEALAMTILCQLGQ